MYFQQTDRGTSCSVNALKQALVKRYSTKDRAWIKRRHWVARRQGPNELLSDYVNDMHELFSGLNMAEVDSDLFHGRIIATLKDQSPRANAGNTLTSWRSG